MSKITSKERLKAAIDRKVPDRLPATTHHLMDSYLNSHLGGMSVPEFFEYFKLDPIHWVNSVEYTAEQLKNWKISSLEEQETNLSSGETEHRDILKKIKEDHRYLIKLEEKAVNALKSF